MSPGMSGELKALPRTGGGNESDKPSFTVAGGPDDRCRLKSEGAPFKVRLTAGLHRLHPGNSL